MKRSPEIQLCRNIFETSGFEDGEDKWQSIVSAVLGPDWMCAEVNSFINHVTSVNINHRMEDFTFVILSPVREMATLQQAMRESRHFNEPMSVFYMINNQTPSNDGKLVDCVGGATIAQKGCSKTFTWPAGHRRNYLEVSADPHFCVDGAVVDDHQKPIQLYHELILAFTCPKDWVIDACSGTVNCQM
ncbi:hypothetical protein BSL78_06207 [Apostichopus japonicus]|uniref:Uncharacterized protein n=1 Tax=Stichopus japonicus TaxID=307972 RepID=A0A2G8L9F0_STIJA|nr:hypothetical protein BSL78_06207 [Apostichopus japonicus]